MISANVAVSIAAKAGRSIQTTNWFSETVTSVKSVQKDRKREASVSPSDEAGVHSLDERSAVGAGGRDGSLLVVPN